MSIKKIRLKAAPQLTSVFIWDMLNTSIRFNYILAYPCVLVNQNGTCCAISTAARRRKQRFVC